jgi:Right handed beta helix region
VSDSDGDGLVLQGDTGTTMKAITATGNKANGVLVGGPASNRPITNITTEKNTGYGLAVVGQKKPQISAIVTTNDGAGGLRLNSTTDAVVTDLKATDQPVGVYAHVGSARATLSKIAFAGGRRGVVLDKTTSAMVLKDSTIASATTVGIDLGGKQVEIDGVTVSDSRSALRIERGADAITASGMTVSGGDDGIVASPGATHVAIRDLTASGVRSDAIRTGSTDAVITGGQITGGSTGIDVAAPTTITGTAVSESNIGIRSASRDLVRAEKVDVAAIAIGITVDPDATFVLANSKVRALEAVRGTLRQEGVNELSLPPLNLLAAIGLPLVLFALLLEVLHVLRQRGVDGNRRRLPRAVPAGAG